MSQQPSGAPGELSPGALLAGYRLEERIGRGGMAVVYRAYDHRLDRQVALKILAPELALDEAFRRRFIRESRAAAAVDDAHIIPVFEAGEADGALFIAMRYVRGGDVRSLLDRTGPLPLARAADFVSQIASALDAAHARGLVHRDVKPANMLLETSPAGDRPEHLYLSDFGLTKAALEASGLTGSGQMVGTLDYVAPEQITARAGAVDGRADQYALACSAFEMLCGVPPFRREQGVSVMYAHLSEEPPSVRQYRPELPADVDQVMGRALAKVPADRYLSCRDLAVALRRALSAGASPAVLPPALTEITPAIPAGHPDTEPSGYRPASAADLQGDEPARPAGVAAAGVAAAARFGRTAVDPDPATLVDYGPAAAASSPALAPRRRWRSRVPVAGLAAFAVAAAAGGAVAFLASRGQTASGASAGQSVTSQHQPAPLQPPGCTTATASAPQLSHVSMTTVTTGGSPFGIAQAPDGRFWFVTTGDGVAVLKSSKGRAAPVLDTTIPVNGVAKDAELTHDGRFLLAAVGNGVAVLNTADAEANEPAVAGSLKAPYSQSQAYAGQVLITPDDHFAFVTLQGANRLVVFNLQRGLAKRLGPADYLGSVPLPTQPVGMAFDGTWLYVTSFAGTLSVVNAHRAETGQPHAVVATVRAGCQPSRALLSDHDQVVWVTDRASDALLAFSTARLRTDPKRALLARVRLGETPTGEALVAGGSRILVADSNVNDLATAPSNVAVVSTAAALKGRPALLGYIPTGAQPRQFAIEPGGKVVLVTEYGAHQVQAIDVGTLPGAGGP